MKKLLLLITLVAGIIAFAMPAQADTLTFWLNTALPENASSSKPDPDGLYPWLKAVFDDDTGLANTVELTFTKLRNNTNKVDLWYFNLDPGLHPTALSDSQVSSTNGFYPKMTTGNSDQKADGDGWFDIEFNFSTATNKAFDGLDWVKILITSSQDIFADSFDFKSSAAKKLNTTGPNTWETVAHVLNITGDPSSTWIGDNDGGEVGGGGGAIPEPATMLLLGSGLIGIAASGKKKFKKRNG